MKQSAKAVSLTGLAGAAAFAGTSQAYGAIVSVTVPTNITGAASTTTSTKEYWDIDTGTTSATQTAASDLEFGYFNGTAPKGGAEFFTGVYGFNGSKAAAYEYGGNNSAYTAYAYGIAKGATIGTGGAYPNFSQHTGYFSLMSFTYNGNPYNSLQTTGTPEYLGFKFLAADGLMHDGWLQLESDTYNSAADPGGLKFIGAAYNTVADGTPGGLIAAGAVPEPGTLSALALGAAALVGVGLKRRRKVGVADAQA